MNLPALSLYGVGACSVWSARINDQGKVVWDGCEQIQPAIPTGYSAVANAEAATYGSSSLTGSGVFNSLALLLVPVGGVILLRILRRKRRSCRSSFRV